MRATLGTTPKGWLPASRRILVVDDNPEARLTLGYLLRDMGHDVQSAKNGRIAIEVARWFEPEFAFVDLVLPDIDGCDLVRDLQSTLGTRVRCVAVTGYGGFDDRLRTASAGCEAHLLKPVDPKSIEALLSSPRPE